MSIKNLDCLQADDTLLSSIRFSSTEQRRVKSLIECFHLVDEFPELNKYRFISKLGEGAFSVVYKCELQSKLAALKHILPSCAATRVCNEIKLLHEIQGHQNIVKLQNVLRNSENVVLHLSYCPHKEFKEYFPTLAFSELRFYFKDLFSALWFCHNKNILHRDIKPDNFLYNPSTRSGVLIDFGLAHKMPSYSKTTSCASQIPEYQKGPSKPCLIAKDKRYKKN